MTSEHKTLDEVFEEIEQWHRDHPWKSRLLVVRARVKEAWSWRRAPHHWLQRARRGYSTADWWSFDTYICGVIADAAENLRDNGHGHPCDTTEEEWNDTLTRIAGPLRAYSEGKFSGTSTYEEDMKQYEEARKAMHLFAENLGGMWD